MKVTVSRDGAVIGVYERKDIQAAVADGSLNSDDRYFIQGMLEWLPLSNLTKTPRIRETEDKSTPERRSIPSTEKHSWKRAATSAGYAIVIVAAFAALLGPNYWSKGLSAAGGLMLIFAARTLS
jgi:hypothetical protein